MWIDMIAQVSTMGVGSFLVRLLAVAAIAFFSTRFLSGVYVKNFSTALVLALILSLLNATVGWLLTVLISPINWITFGLFSGLIALVINAGVIKIADGILGDFKVKNFWWAIGLALILSLVTGIFNISFGVNM